MQVVTSNGITLEYDEFGASDAPVILLIMGLGTQMIGWAEPFCELLAERGYRVIRFDNRDVGLSQKFDGQRAPGPLQFFIHKSLGLPLNVPYTLSEMALDALGLLDSLHIEKAHVIGASMGGMIAQIIAPTLVIHGTADRLVPVAAGVDTAKHIPGATLELIEGMGHDLPRLLWPQLVELIARHVK